MPSLLDETIGDNSYPISRPLFIYVNNAKYTDNEATAAYVDFYIENLEKIAEASPLSLRDRRE